MSEFTKQYQFTQNTRFNLNTSLPIDDAIQYLMGDCQGPLYETSHHSDDPHYLDRLSYGDEIKLQQEEALGDYVEAKSAMVRRQKGKLDVDEVAITDAEFTEIEEWLNSTTQELAKYHEYRCDIMDELSKGDRSELHVDQGKTKHPDFPFITLSSFINWAKNKYPVAAATPVKKPPRTKMLDQEDAILSALHELGHVPTRLPKRIEGMRWVKADVLSLLENNPLIKNEKVFDNAWQRLTKSNQIAEE